MWIDNGPLTWEQYEALAEWKMVEFIILQFKYVCPIFTGASFCIEKYTEVVVSKLS